MHLCYDQLCVTQTVVNIQRNYPFRKHQGSFKKGLINIQGSKYTLSVEISSVKSDEKIA